MRSHRSTCVAFLIPKRLAVSLQLRFSFRIVSMTSNAFEEDRQSALKAGMDGHIAKPLDIPHLLQVLADVLKS